MESYYSEEENVHLSKVQTQINTSVLKVLDQIEKLDKGKVFLQREPDWTDSDSYLIDEIKTDVIAKKLTVYNFETLQFLLMRVNQHRINQLESFYKDVCKNYADMFFTECQALEAKIKKIVIERGNSSSLVHYGSDDHIFRITKNGHTKQLDEATFTELSKILRDLTA